MFYVKPIFILKIRPKISPPDLYPYNKQYFTHEKVLIQTINKFLVEYNFFSNIQTTNLVKYPQYALRILLNNLSNAHNFLIYHTDLKVKKENTVNNRNIFTYLSFVNQTWTMTHFGWNLELLLYKKYSSERCFSVSYRQMARNVSLGCLSQFIQLMITST